MPNNKRVVSRHSQANTLEKRFEAAFHTFDDCLELAQWAVQHPKFKPTKEIWHYAATQPGAVKLLIINGHTQYIEADGQSGSAFYAILGWFDSSLSLLTFGPPSQGAYNNNARQAKERENLLDSFELLAAAGEPKIDENNKDELLGALKKAIGVDETTPKVKQLKFKAAQNSLTLPEKGDYYTLLLKLQFIREVMNRIAEPNPHYRFDPSKHNTKITTPLVYEDYIASIKESSTDENMVNTFLGAIHPIRVDPWKIPHNTPSVAGLFLAIEAFTKVSLSLAAYGQQHPELFSEENRERVASEFERITAPTDLTNPWVLSQQEEQLKRLRQEIEQDRKRETQTWSPLYQAKTSVASNTAADAPAEENEGRRSRRPSFGSEDIYY